MGIANPGEASRRIPQDIAGEFDALWEQSQMRAESRPGLDLDQLKQFSSRLRRMAKGNATPERAGGTQRREPCDWLASSRRAG